MSQAKMTNSGPLYPPFFVVVLVQLWCKLTPSLWYNITTTIHPPQLFLTNYILSKRIKLGVKASHSLWGNNLSSCTVFSVCIISCTVLSVYCILSCTVFLVVLYSQFYFILSCTVFSVVLYSQLYCILSCTVFSVKSFQRS